MALKSVCIFWSLRSCLGMAERWLYYEEFSPRFNEMYTGALFEYYRGILWEVNIQLSGINRHTNANTRRARPVLNAVYGLFFGALELYVPRINYAVVVSRDRAIVNNHFL